MTVRINFLPRSFQTRASLETLLRALVSPTNPHEPQKSSYPYTNAKVVIVGNSGVGKSGLALVLSDHPFVPTESTHGRKIYSLGRDLVTVGQHQELREILLWDLAGQPGYRLFHQLHLHEISVALVVFDGSDDLDPLSGVRYWVRALRQAEKHQKAPTQPVVRFLVAARTDICGTGLPRHKLEALTRELGFHGMFETSSKNGTGILELRRAISDAIQWESLPPVKQFHAVLGFAEKQLRAGLVTFRTDELKKHVAAELGLLSSDLIQHYCDTGLQKAESIGMVRRIRSDAGSLVLLEPEVVDTYAAAIINAAREETNGMGFVRESLVLEGQLYIPVDKRLPDPSQEEIILAATINELLYHEVALRETTWTGTQLVFPGQVAQDLTSEPEGKSWIYVMDGPVDNVYTTLIVRLAHCGLFSLTSLWKNAAELTVPTGGKFTTKLTYLEPGRAELTLYVGIGTSEEVQFYFSKFTEEHLESRAILVRRRRIFLCSGCRLGYEPDAPRQNELVPCPRCGTRIALTEGQERVVESRRALAKMTRKADEQKEAALGMTRFEPSTPEPKFGAFLAHNSMDKPFVLKVHDQLKKRGINAWVDKLQIRPGESWQLAIQKGIYQSACTVVFIGQAGIGKTQGEEIDYALREARQQGRLCIPALLPGVESVPSDWPFLGSRHWVKFSRSNDVRALEQLVWGITGQPPAG